MRTHQVIKLMSPVTRRLCFDCGFFVGVYFTDRTGRIFFLGTLWTWKIFTKYFFPDNVVYVSWILTCSRLVSSANNVVLSARLAAARKEGRKN